MASSILNAIAGGFTGNRILKEITKRFPKHADNINNAIAAGYTAKSILKKLTHPSESPHDANEYLTEHERGIRANKQQSQRAAMGLVGTLGTAGALAAGLTHLLKKPEELPERKELLEKFKNIPESKIPEPKKKTSLLDGITEKEPFEPVKPEPVDSIKKLEESFPQLNAFVKKNIEAGKSPDEISEAINKSKLLKPLVSRIEQSEGRPFVERIKEEFGQKPKIAKEEVITPFGSGEIHKVHKDTAFVKTEKGLQKIPLSEIQEPPESAVEAVTNYLNIPEQDRSSNVALFAWNPEERKAYFQFHNEDSFYEYSDVDPEVVEAIAAKRAIPKTMGSNEYGIWSPEDTESIGAALWKYIISTPKYAKTKKGETANPFYKKLPIKYDYWVKLRKPKRRKG